LVECKLKPPGYLLGIKLRSRVAWVKSSGRPHGMGLQFLFDSERKRNKLKRIINKLSIELSRQLIQKPDEKKP
jgi:Tfp pilus assembly protein PilZ